MERSCKKCGKSKHMKKQLNIAGTRNYEYNYEPEEPCYAERWRICFKCKPTLENEDEIEELF